MTIFLTSLTIITGAFLSSISNIVLTKINVIPIWLWVVCIFCFYFLVIDKWEAKKTAKKEIREKERQAKEKVRQEELWYSNQKNRLKNLTPSEQEILRGYIINKTYTQTLKVTDGVVIGMENDGIIQRVGKIPNDDKWGFDFNINKWIWEYLNNYPELLEITNKKTT